MDPGGIGPTPFSKNKSSKAIGVYFYDTTTVACHSNVDTTEWKIVLQSSENLFASTLENLVSPTEVYLISMIIQMSILRNEYIF